MTCNNTALNSKYSELCNKVITDFLKIPWPKVNCYIKPDKLTGA